MSLVLRLPREMHLSRSSSNAPRLPPFLEMLQDLHVLLTLDTMHNPLRLPRETTSECPKVVRTSGAFNILTWKFVCVCVARSTFWASQLPKVVRAWCALRISTSKCASRHNGVHFFDISTSKSGLRMMCFVHFDLEMCFAPQRSLFPQPDFQKCCERDLDSTFWLGHVLRATTACTFSTSQLPRVLRSWGVLYILTSTCASRHNGVQFFISHLASWLRTRRFSEPTFRPSGATNHWKNKVFRDFPTFSRICIFFLLTLSLLWSSLFYSWLLWLFPPLLFHLSILSEVWLLSFLRQLQTTLITIHYTTPHYTTPHHTTLTTTTFTTTTTLLYTALGYTTVHYITEHSWHHHKCSCNYTTLVTLHHNYDSTTLQLQLQLHYTTLHPAVVGEVTEQDHCNHCNHSQKHNSNHLSVHQWICFAIRDSQQPSSPIYLYIYI